MKPARTLPLALVLTATAATIASAATVNLRPYALQPSDVGGARPVYDRPQTGIPKVFRAAATRRFSSARAGGSVYKLNQDLYLATSPYFSRAVYRQLLGVELPKTLKGVAASIKLTKTVQRPWKVGTGEESGGRLLEGSTTTAQPGVPKGTRVRVYVAAVRIGSALTVLTAFPQGGEAATAESGLRVIVTRAAKREARLGTR